MNNFDDQVDLAAMNIVSVASEAIRKKNWLKLKINGWVEKNVNGIDYILKDIKYLPTISDPSMYGMTYFYNLDEVDMYVEHKLKVHALQKSIADNLSSQESAMNYLNNSNSSSAIPTYVVSSDSDSLSDTSSSSDDKDSANEVLPSSSRPTRRRLPPKQLTLDFTAASKFNEQNTNNGGVWQTDSTNELLLSNSRSEKQQRLTSNQISNDNSNSGESSGLWSLSSSLLHSDTLLSDFIAEQPTATATASSAAPTNELKEERGSTEVPSHVLLGNTPPAPPPAVQAVAKQTATKVTRGRLIMNNTIRRVSSGSGGTVARRTNTSNSVKPAFKTPSTATTPAHTATTEVSPPLTTPSTEKRIPKRKALFLSEDVEVEEEVTYLSSNKNKNKKRVKANEKNDIGSNSNSVSGSSDRRQPEQPHQSALKSNTVSAATASSQAAEERTHNINGSGSGVWWADQPNLNQHSQLQQPYSQHPIGNQPLWSKDTSRNALPSGSKNELGDNQSSATFHPQCSAHNTQQYQTTGSEHMVTYDTLPPRTSHKPPNSHNGPAPTYLERDAKLDQFWESVGSFGNWSPTTAGLDAAGLQRSGEQQYSNNSTVAVAGDGRYREFFAQHGAATGIDRSWEAQRCSRDHNGRDLVGCDLFGHPQQHQHRHSIETRDIAPALLPVAEPVMAVGYPVEAPPQYTMPLTNAYSQYQYQQYQYPVAPMTMVADGMGGYAWAPMPAVYSYTVPFGLGYYNPIPQPYIRPPPPISPPPAHLVPAATNNQRTNNESITQQYQSHAHTNNIGSVSGSGDRFYSAKQQLPQQIEYIPTIEETAKYGHSAQKIGSTLQKERQRKVQLWKEGREKSLRK